MHATPSRELYPPVPSAGLGGGRSVQVVPFQISAIAAEIPGFSLYPTATQNVGVLHETEVSTVPSPAGFASDA